MQQAVAIALEKNPVRKAALAEQQAAAAEADFEPAQATFRRYQDLYEKKSVSAQEFDEVRARHRAATARRELAQAGRGQVRAVLAQAQTQLDYTRIRAPFAGLVTEKRAHTGSLASPGLVLLVAEDTRRFLLEVSVDESEIRFIHPGQAVPVLYYLSERSA